MIATVVDVGALWTTIWHAALSGVVVSAVVGVAVRSYARSHDLRIEGHTGPASAHAAVTAVACAIALAIAAYGLYLIAG